MWQKLRQLLLTVAVLCALAPIGRATPVISQTALSRYGLTRAWYAQVGTPRVNGTIAHVNLERGTVLVQSTGGMLCSLDPESGRIMWSAQVGPSHHLSTEPAANDKHVVVVNGSVMYVLDRASGHVLWQRQLSGSPGAGPGVSATHAFVPMVSGKLEGYNLDKGPRQTPWVYKSAGRVLIPPMTTGQTVSWTTEKGYFYVADPSAAGIRYRLETRKAIQARPGYWTPNLYACSTDGYVYAVNEETGRIAWKFAVGDAIFTSPVAIEDKVFVVSEASGLYCLDAKKAELLWNAPKIKQFVATSRTRVYACDQLGRLVVLDAKRGIRLGAMALDGISLKVINDQSDRIYLASDDGVMQCLREVNLRSPLAYEPPAPFKGDEIDEKPKAVSKPVAKPADTQDKTEADEPSDDSDKPADTKSDDAGGDDIFK